MLDSVSRAARGGRSSVGRAPGCGPGGRGFESRRSPYRRPWTAATSSFGPSFRSFALRSNHGPISRRLASTRFILDPTRTHPGGLGTVVGDRGYFRPGSRRQAGVSGTADSSSLQERNRGHNRATVSIAEKSNSREGLLGRGFRGRGFAWKRGPRLSRLVVAGAACVCKRPGGQAGEGEGPHDDAGPFS